MPFHVPGALAFVGQFGEGNFCPRDMRLGEKRAMPIQDTFSEAAPMIAQDNSNRVSIALAVSNTLAGGFPDGM